MTVQGAASMTPVLVGYGSGTFAAALNVSPSLANGNGVVPTQGGSALSATNGGYQNILQGNAAVSATNPLFDELSDGTHTDTIKAAGAPSVAGDTSLVVQLNPNQPNLATALNVAIPANSSINLNEWAGATLGAPSNYGTSPGAVAVPGVNAYVTNMPAVSQSGTWTVTDQVSTNNAAATPHICGSHTYKTNITTATDTEIVALSSGKTIYVCGYSIAVGGTATNAYLEDGGTSASCAGTKTQIDQIWYIAANGTGGLANPYYQGIATIAGHDLCLHTSAAGPTDVSVYYDQY
jgi:hypothetical protein